ncbi:MAG: hypothetical protein ACE5PM_02155 [Candidatus Hydrothermarchaeales archaeon]
MHVRWGTAELALSLGRATCGLKKDWRDIETSVTASCRRQAGPSPVDEAGTSKG